MLRHAIVNNGQTIDFVEFDYITDRAYNGKKSLATFKHAHKHLSHIPFTHAHTFLNHTHTLIIQFKAHTYYRCKHIDMSKCTRAYMTFMVMHVFHTALNTQTHN